MFSRAGAWFHEHKRLVLITSAVVVLAVSAGAIFVVLKTEDKVERTSTDTSQAPEKIDNRVASPLTGKLVEPKLAQRPVTGVMIENSPDARPQSGLRDAGFVFEAIAEGGITRFAAFYQESQPKEIGPVRSLRQYYTDWFLTLDASIAHVGGPAIAVNEVRNKSNITDLDQFFNAAAYERVGFRYAPHNVYTDAKRLDILNKAKGHTKSDFTPIPRKSDQPAENPTAERVTIPISSFLFNLEYRYDSKTNTYVRYMGGRAHKERNGKRVAPKVVIAMEATRGIHSDGEHTVYDLVGTGRAFIFQDGKAVKGKWAKTGRSNQVKFMNGSGKALKLNRGQTWVTAVDPGTSVRWR